MTTHGPGRRLRRQLARVALAALLGAGLGLTSGWPAIVAAQAQQGAANVLGGFSRDSGPINITADALNINDQKKTAVYKGNVVAVQGDNTLRTVELEVQYTTRDDDQKAQKGKSNKTTNATAGAGLGDGGQQIKRIKAKQKVVMVSTPGGKEAQSATSDAADYDVAGQMVELRGNVFIKQGENVICGSKVTMNLRTSEYAVERDPTGAPAAHPECGRVRTVIFPKKKDDGTPAAGKTSSTGSTKAPASGKQPASSSWTTTSPR